MSLSDTNISKITGIPRITLAKWKKANDYRLSLYNLLKSSDESFLRKKFEKEKVVFITYTQETFQYKPELIGHKDEYYNLLEKAVDDARLKGLEVVFVPFNYDDFMRFSKGKDSPDLRAQWAALKVQNKA